MLVVLLSLRYARLDHNNRGKHCKYLRSLSSKLDFFDFSLLNLYKIFIYR